MKLNALNDKIQTVLEKIKQIIQAKAARLRQYKKRSRFYHGDIYLYLHFSTKITNYLKTIRINSIEISVNHKSK